jgi:cytochrome c oxidase subunit II
VKVHSYETAFVTVGGIVLVACGAALIYASVGHGIHLPGAAGRLEPSNVYSTPPFSQPGVRQTGPNQYEAVLVAQSWLFIPAEIRVPAGAEVTIIATAVDIIHGLAVAGTRVNMMLIPGQISRNTYQFDRPGEYLLICHEYCGIAHHTMAGKLIVESPQPAVAGPVESPASEAVAQ